MLSVSESKQLIIRTDSRLDKLLFVVGTFDKPCLVKQIRGRATECGLRIPKHWNVSDILKTPRKLAVLTSYGWELTDKGVAHLRSLGAFKGAPAAAKVRDDLQAQIGTIKGTETRAFMQEALSCFEHELFRAAVIMSWIAAMHVLHREVHAHHLAAFNTEAQRVNSKWKNAKTTDDLGIMTEDEFLDRVSGISMLGKNVRKELGVCLGLRNGCGHPNLMKLGENKVASHFETLLLNVFTKFNS